MVAKTEEGRLAETKPVMEMLDRFLHFVGADPLAPGVTFLDVGSGFGTKVKLLRQRGVNACGVDFFPNPLGIPDPSIEEREYLRSIETNPYHLPFPEQYFDVVFSTQVIEHVVNLEETFQELHRVMKPGAIGIHIYPSTWRFLESHFHVPFGGGVKWKPWITGWMLLGVGDRRAGESKRAAADRHWRYLIEQTRYRSAKEVLRCARGIFGSAEWREFDYLRAATGRAAALQNLGPALPLAAWFYRYLVSRVLVVRKMRN